MLPLASPSFSLPFYLHWSMLKTPGKFLKLHLYVSVTIILSCSHNVSNLSAGLMVMRFSLLGIGKLVLDKALCICWLSLYLHFLDGGESTRLVLYSWYRLFIRVKTPYASDSMPPMFSTGFFCTSFYLSFGLCGSQRFRCVSILMFIYMHENAAILHLSILVKKNLWCWSGW